MTTYKSLQITWLGLWTLANICFIVSVSLCNLGTLATSVLSVTDGTVRAIARWAGLRPLAAELPEGAPVAIVGDALLYREGPDAGGIVLSVACARILESAGIPAVDSDSWLLADMLSPGDVFDGKSLSE